MNSEKLDKKEQLKYRTYYLSIKVIKFTSTLPNQRIYSIIADQLVRSATSIGANIIEAQGASSKKDFAKFFQIAFKSAIETKYWLGLLRDGTQADKEEIKVLLDEVGSVTKMLSTSLITLKKGLNSS